jgi:hypothetical protein
VLGARFWMITPPKATLLIVKYGYWAVALTFAGFAVLLANQLLAGGGLWKRCQAHRTGLLCVLLAGVYFQVHEPREFKVLFDEFVISGVARNMHFDREATFPTRAHYIYGRLLMMASSVDKRPFFFPFLISLVHDFTGYRAENVFYLNACMAVILLLLVYAFGFTHGGTRLGCLGVLLLAGLPLIAQNATDGGYELANLVMILTLYFLGSIYYRSSGTKGLDLFIMAAALLSQVRYESALYVFVVAAVVLCKWVQERQITLTWAAVISPVMFLMPLLVNQIQTANPGFYQTKPGQAFLSFHYFRDNASVAMYYLFDPNFDSTNSVLLSVFGLFGVAFFIFLTGKKIRQWLAQRKEEVVLFFVFFATCISTLVVLCVFWGHWDDPMVARFSLPLQLLMVILALRVAAEFLKFRPLPKWILILAGMWMGLFAVPASARLWQTDNMITAREYRWLFEYLSHKDPTTTLTISGSVLGPILHGMPTISILDAQRSRWQLKTCLSKNIYREIIVIQRFKLDYDTGKFVESGPRELGDGFKLETVAEQRFRPDMISRISRMVDVDLAKVPAPPGFEEEEKKEHFADESALVKHMVLELP